MDAIIEGTHAGGFLLSEANFHRSRENVTILSGQDLKAGTVLGKITASGKYVAYDSNNGDGEETAAGILLADCDASDADTPAAIIARDAEVNGEELVYKTATPAVDEAGAVTDLLALGIIVRTDLLA
jgi:hypothetical protein